MQMEQFNDVVLFFFIIIIISVAFLPIASGLYSPVCTSTICCVLCLCGTMNSTMNDMHVFFIIIILIFIPTDRAGIGPWFRAGYNIPLLAKVSCFCEYPM